MSSNAVGLTLGLVAVAAICLASVLSAGVAFLAGAGLRGCLMAAGWGRVTTEAPPLARGSGAAAIVCGAGTNASWVLTG